MNPSFLVESKITWKTNQSKVISPQFLNILTKLSFIYSLKSNSMTLPVIELVGGNRVGGNTRWWLIENTTLIEPFYAFLILSVVILGFLLKPKIPLCLYLWYGQKIQNSCYKQKCCIPSTLIGKILFVKFRLYIVYINISKLGWYCLFLFGS